LFGYGWVVVVLVDLSSADTFMVAGLFTAAIPGTDAGGCEGERGSGVLATRLLCRACQNTVTAL